MLLSTTYTEFKEDVYERLGDLSKLDCGDFNALKIVLDGLKVQYSKRGVYRHTVYGSLVGQKLESVARKILQRPDVSAVQAALNKFSERKILLAGTTTEDPSTNEWYSVHYNHILRNLPDPENAVYVTDKAVARDKKSDIELFPLFSFVRTLQNDDEETELIHSIRRATTYIERLNKFTATELLDIKTAFENFFQQFRVWKYALDRLKIETCFFRCHYHREGMLLACKRKNIRLIELQHGLIAPEDIFYVFPPQVKPIREKALFADKILVYGDYWKNVLLKGTEYPAATIDTIGFYNDIRNAVSSDKRKSFVRSVNGKKVVLLTCQTGSHQYFIDYARLLEEIIERDKYTEYIVVVKPHSNEPHGLYEKALAGLKHVLVYQDEIDFVLTQSCFLITIYSTTVFDAMRYGLPSFSLRVPEYMDYVDNFIGQGFSYPLGLTDNPFVRIPDSSTFKPGVYYSPFNPQAVKDSLTT